MHLELVYDIAILSRTPMGAESELRKLEDHLAKSGLFISSGEEGKSASFRIDVDGKRKLWIVNTESYLVVNGEVTPAMSVVETYQYLGVKFKFLGVRTDIHVDLAGGGGGGGGGGIDGKPQNIFYSLSSQLC